MPQSASPVVRTQKIVVNPTSRSVSVINAGPLGPPGAQGIQGPQGVQGPTGSGATDPTVYTRLTSVESKNTTQDGRLDTNESKNTTQDTRLTSVEGVNTTQDGRITSTENTNTWQGSEIAGLDGRLDTAESNDTAHNTRFTNVEAVNTYQGAEIANLDGRIDVLEAKLPQGVSISRTAQSIPTGTITPIAFTFNSTEVFDTNNFRDFGNFVIPAGLGGDYMLCGGGQFVTNGTGTYRRIVLAIASNTGVAGEVGGVGMTTSANGTKYLSASKLVRLKAGATVTLEVQQDSGANLDFTPWMTLHMVRSIPTL